MSRREPFPADFAPAGESGKSYRRRRESGFFAKYCSGDTILDIGNTGAANPDNKTFIPSAIGIDIGYPGYDGLVLPFADESVDCVYSSHCLEHVQFYQAVIREWHRVVKFGGFVVCIVPSLTLYEKKRFPPSRYNADHKRFYTPSRLLHEFEEALEPNSVRVRHLCENDDGYDYGIGPEQHAVGCYEIELVVEKIRKPAWPIA
jgi:SAM-dependent methyltransferase